MTTSSAISREDLQLRIEERAMNAWPALQTQVYEGCILRFANGYTKRANSANPLYLRTAQYAPLVDYCEAAYRRAGLPVVFKMLDAPRYAELDRLLASRGYERGDETLVMLLDLEAHRAPRDPAAIVEPSFSEEWLQLFLRINDVGANAAAAQAMLANLLNETIAIRLRSGGRDIACGYGAMEGDHVGLFDIVVEAPQRGKGFGRALVQSLLAAARERGARTAYLQVMLSNPAALRLYAGLGFEESYRYWYRRAMR